MHAGLQLMTELQITLGFFERLEALEPIVVFEVLSIFTINLFAINHLEMPLSPLLHFHLVDLEQ